MTINDAFRPFETDSLAKTYTLYSQKAIYPGVGVSDNRQDWCDLDQNSPFRRTALQTVCLIPKKNLIKRSNGSYELQGRRFMEAQKLCGTEERFSLQPVGGFCSGFAVSDKLIVTAGHCVTSVADLEAFYVVFNFRQDDINTTHTVFTPDEVFKPIAVVQRAEDGSGNDFAVVRVDGNIPKNRISTIRTSAVANGEEVFVIGHPCGLPLKIADGASVQSNSNSKFFIADLDTFGGNSGSAVYDAKHNVIGILVRGATDFDYNRQKRCYSTHVCSLGNASDCSGEEISRTSQFTPFLIGQYKLTN